MRSHAAVAELAAKQHGLVTHAQLLRLGFSGGGISRLTKARRLHRVHRRVYAVGHALLSDNGRCLAAAMACGRGAVVSHEAAAWLWGLLPSCPRGIDVTVPRHGGKRSKIRLHHSSTLVAEEHGKFGPIPATALPRTLLDLAATTSPRFTWSAIDEERFAVEVDGWEAHRTRKAFEDDRLRQVEMRLAGIDVVPISARRIEQQPDEVGRHLTLLLQRRRRELGLR